MLHLTRREFIKDVGLVALGGGLAGIIAGRTAPRAHVGRRKPGDKPNIVIILADALRADYVGAYGGRMTNYQGEPVSPTPNIDILAREGTLFTSAYGHSITRLSMFSLHSGQIRSAMDPAYEGRYSCYFPTFPELFRQNGYRTQLLSANPVHYTFSANTRGYEIDDIYFGRSCYIDGKWRRHTDVEGAYVDARTLLEGIGKAPFMWYLHIIPPHAPYDPTARFRDCFDRGKRWAKEKDVFLGELLDARIKKADGLPERPQYIRHHLDKITPRDLDHIKAMYAANILSADWFVGRVVNQLDWLGILDNTVLVIMSDHGEEFLEHGGIMHDGSMYEEDIRIPLIFRWPLGVVAGNRVDDFVSLADIPATLLDWAGVQDELGDGRTLRVPLTRKMHSPHRTSIISDAEGVAIREREEGKEWKAIIYDFQVVLSNGVKVWRRNRGDRPPELYDLSTDPGEQHNIADRHPEHVGRFTQMAADYVASGEKLWHGYVPHHGGPRNPKEIPSWDEEFMRAMNRAACGEKEAEETLGRTVDFKDILELDKKLLKGKISQEAAERLRALGYVGMGGVPSLQPTPTP